MNEQEIKAGNKKLSGKDCVLLELNTLLKLLNQSKKDCDRYIKNMAKKREFTDAILLQGHQQGLNEAMQKIQKRIWEIKPRKD